MMRAMLLMAVMSTTACTLLWGFNSGEEGLSCGLPNGNEPRCLPGFFCGEGDICRKGGIVIKNDPCNDTEECADNRFCGDALSPICATTPDDVNCGLYDNVDGSNAFGLRCRDTCDPAQLNPGCGENERCFGVDGIDGVPGVCHPGTCNANSSCGNIDLCLDLQGEGLTGLCFEACDPTTCLSGPPCVGCEGQDGQPDAARTCAVPVGFDLAFPPVCFAAGTLGPGENCSGDAFQCRVGTTCVAAGDGSAVCRAFCRDEGDCNINTPICTLGTDTLGICVPLPE
jgi:hypothetical protein